MDPRPDSCGVYHWQEPPDFNLEVPESFKNFTVPDLSEHVEYSPTGHFNINSLDLTVAFGHHFVSENPVLDFRKEYQAHPVYEFVSAEVLTHG